ncbi:MAG: hypothetical protein GX425_14100 [Peptococcaceae bacterium]|nr:hypothetical protein [Peptococcaceae bacterium]
MSKEKYAFKIGLIIFTNKYYLSNEKDQVGIYYQSRHQQQNTDSNIVADAQVVFKFQEYINGYN